MNVFKTAPGANERIIISEENYAKATGKSSKYCRKSNDGKLRYFAVCPICDNPIQIVGLYKKHNEGKYPYGKHHKGNVANLADYDEEDYLNCPYSKPSLDKSKTRRKPNSKTSLALYNLLLNQFDRLIYILNKTTGIKISYGFAEILLKSYADNEGWEYYDSTYDNLPYMLLYAEQAYSLVNRLIAKDSDVYNALAEKCPEVSLERVNEKYFKIIPNKKEYVDLYFYLTQHSYNEKDIELEENYMLVIENRGNVLLRKKITVNPDYLRNLINLPNERSFRDQHFLDIATKVLK